MDHLLNLRPMSFMVMMSFWAAAMAQGVPSLTAKTIETRTDGERVTVDMAGRPVLVYRYSDTPFKPYVSLLYTPGGINILRDSPPDHVHHHGLMYAVSIDGVDFWAEFDKASNGKQVHRGIDSRVRQNARSARVVVSGWVDWQAPDGTVLAQEKRKVSVVQREGLDATLVTWRTELATAEGRTRMELTGHHYFGLGMRFVESMDKIGRFINDKNDPGEHVRGSERLVRAHWCAYTSKVDGQPVTVAMFDHPENVRSARWFTMTTPFAYLSATLNLHEQPLTVKRSEPLRLTYGVAVWDGVKTSGEIEALYEKWLQWSGAIAQGSSTINP